MVMEIPRGLWRLANGLLVASVVGVAVLAFALARGWADPPSAGPLWLFENFAGDTARWSFITRDHASADTETGALIIEFDGAGEALTLTAPPAAEEYSIEMAGVASVGTIAYGVVFDWKDETHYSAVLINSNGYAEAFRQNGAERAQWFAWKQWPHIGTEANRVRVEVRGQRVTVRINDELLTTVAEATGAGQLGVLVQSSNVTGEVRVSWVQVWADAP